MKRTHIDDLLFLFMYFLLVCDVSFDMQGIGRYFNYMFLAYYIIRASVKIYLWRKAPATSDDRTLKQQWASLLKEVALMLNVIVAVMDAF